MRFKTLGGVRASAPSAIPMNNNKDDHDEVGVSSLLYIAGTCEQKEHTHKYCHTRFF